MLLRRVCTTPIWWITTTFVYYGLSINATGLSDTMYLNYILTAAIEIPGFFTAVLILDRIGRKPTMCTGYLFSAACNIAFAFIPQGQFCCLLIFVTDEPGLAMEIVKYSLRHLSLLIYDTLVRDNYNTSISRVVSLFHQCLLTF